MNMYSNEGYEVVKTTATMNGKPLYKVWLKIDNGRLFVGYKTKSQLNRSV